jgi:hypothetical protein
MKEKRGEKKPTAEWLFAWLKSRSNSQFMKRFRALFAAEAAAAALDEPLLQCRTCSKNK